MAELRAPRRTPPRHASSCPPVQGRGRLGVHARSTSSTSTRSRPRRRAAPTRRSALRPGGRRAAPRPRRRLRGPARHAAARGARAHPDLVGRTSAPSSARLFARAQRRAVDRRHASSTSRATSQVDAPILLTTVHEQAGTALHHAHARRARGGRRGRGLGPDALGATTSRGPRQRRRRARRRRRTPSCATSARRTSNEKSWVFGAQRAIVAATATSTGRRSASAAATARSSSRPTLDGPGAHAAVTGAYATRGRQHVDFDTLQEHAAADTTSDLAFRGILDGRSTRRLARDDQGRRGRPADRRLPGVAQPAARQEGPRRRDPRPRDPRRRRALHARRGDRPDRPRADLLPALARPAAGTGAQRLVVEGFLGALVERFDEGPRPRRGRRRARRAASPTVLG